MGNHCRIPKTLASLMGQAFFDAGNDVQGSTNAAGAWMRRSDHLDLATATFTGFDVDIKTRFNRCIHVMARCRSSELLSSQAVPLGSAFAVRLAGIT